MKYFSHTSSSYYYFFKGKSVNSKQRFRYGRLSVDSDDQNLNSKHEDVEENLLVNIDLPCCKETATTRKNLTIDQNGNDNRNRNEVCDNLNNNNLDNFSMRDNNNGNNNGNEKEKIKSAVTRLQALAMSDDEDFGKFLKIDEGYKEMMRYIKFTLFLLKRVGENLLTKNHFIYQLENPIFDMS